MSWLLTQDQFTDLKDEYPVYGTHVVEDDYGSDTRVRDDEPKCMIYTMWHPLTDAVGVAEYGRDISSMLYAIVYDEPDVKHSDRIIIRGVEFEVAGVKWFNCYYRVDVRRLEASGDGK